MNHNKSSHDNLTVLVGRGKCLLLVSRFTCFYFCYFFFFVVNHVPVTGRCKFRNIEILTFVWTRADMSLFICEILLYKNLLSFRLMSVYLETNHRQPNYHNVNKYLHLLTDKGASCHKFPVVVVLQTVKSMVT